MRRALPEDLPRLHALELAILRDGRGQVTTAEAADDVGAYARRIERYFVSPDAAMLVVEDGDAIVALAPVRRYEPALTRHVAALSLGVHPAAQRRGHGRALLRGVCAIARDELAVTRLELFMRADNARAKALYESEGFEVEGARRRFVRLADGTEVDDLILVRFFDAPQRR